jgi:hypothetical protein
MTKMKVYHDLTNDEMTFVLQEDMEEQEKDELLKEVFTSYNIPLLQGNLFTLAELVEVTTMSLEGWKLIIDMMNVVETSRTFKEHTQGASTRRKRTMLAKVVLNLLNDME